MGTSSLTIVYDENNLAICAMCLPFDGYPDAHGAALAEFLKEHRGMSMATLAAALVSEFLPTQEDAELVPPSTASDAYREWEYAIFVDVVKVNDEDKTCTANWADSDDFEHLCMNWDDTAADSDSDEE